MKYTSNTSPLTPAPCECECIPRPFKGQGELIPIEVNNEHSRPQPNADKNFTKFVFTVRMHGEYEVGIKKEFASLSQEQEAKPKCHLILLANYTKLS